VALYHVHADVIVKGKSQGGAAGFAQYMARDDRDPAARHSRYLQRDGWSDEDLVAKGQGALPTWARDATHFFQVADQQERQRGCVARTYEIALPRELSPDERLALAADIRATFFEQYPHAWAIHNPIDPEGGEHPHMHLMLNERRVTDGVARGPDRYFRQPTGGGVRKDTAFQGPARLRAIRAGIAVLTNAALERAGLPLAVSHESLRARGETRAPAVYTRAAAKAEVEARREEVHQWDHPYETRINLVRWQQQKAQEGLTDLSREAIIDHVRDTFWLQDTSPVRERERDASVWRTIHREHARTGRPLQGPRAPQRPTGREVVQDLEALAAQLDALSNEAGGRGTGRVRLWDREQGVGF
jgi:hypothetical protein